MKIVTIIPAEFWFACIYLFTFWLFFGMPGMVGAAILALLLSL